MKLCPQALQQLEHEDEWPGLQPLSGRSKVIKVSVLQLRGRGPNPSTRSICSAEVSLSNRLSGVSAADRAL